MQIWITPLLIIAALAFVYVYQNNQATHDTQRARHQVEMQQFNKDFADAWNGDSIQKPDPQELATARTRLGEAQAKADAQKAATAKKLDQLGAELEADLRRSTDSPTAGVSTTGPNPLFTGETK